MKAKMAFHSSWLRITVLHISVFPPFACVSVLPLSASSGQTGPIWQLLGSVAVCRLDAHRNTRIRDTVVQFSRPKDLKSSLALLHFKELSFKSQHFRYTSDLSSNVVFCQLCTFILGPPKVHFLCSGRFHCLASPLWGVLDLTPCEATFWKSLCVQKVFNRLKKMLVVISRNCLSSLILRNKS